MFATAAYFNAGGVHIDIELRPPSQLFYYGQLGDLSIVNTFAVALVGAGRTGTETIQNYAGAGVTTSAGLICWDQAIHDTANGTADDAVGLVEVNFAEGTETPHSKLGSAKKTATMDMYSLNVPIYDEAILSNADNPEGAIAEIIGNAVALKIDNLLTSPY